MEKQDRGRVWRCRTRTISKGRAALVLPAKSRGQKGSLSLVHLILMVDVEEQQQHRSVKYIKKKEISPQAIYVRSISYPCVCLFSDVDIKNFPSILQQMLIVLEALCTYREILCKTVMKSSCFGEWASVRHYQQYKAGTG